MVRRTTVRLSEEARRGWWKAKRGQSFTAVVEAVGRALDDGTLELPDEVLETARQVDDERHTR